LSSKKFWHIGTKRRWKEYDSQQFKDIHERKKYHSPGASRANMPRSRNASTRPRPAYPRVPPSTLEAIAGALGVKVKDLFNEVDG